MFIKGEWVDFTNKKGITYRAFVIVPLETHTTIEVITDDHKPGQAYERKMFHVPNEYLSLSGNSFLPHDKDLYIDLALATNDREWFNSLTGSLKVAQ